MSTMVVVSQTLLSSRKSNAVTSRMRCNKEIFCRINNFTSRINGHATTWNEFQIPHTRSRSRLAYPCSRQYDVQNDNNICHHGRRNPKNLFSTTSTTTTSKTMQDGSPGFPEVTAIDRNNVDKTDNNTTVKKSSAITDYLDLAKARLSSLVVVTTGVGFVAAGPIGLDSTSILVSCLVGTALCSSSAAAWNQIIERDRDKKMKRTQVKRPLVTGNLSVNAASTAACIWGIAGPTILYVGTDPVTASLGVANIVLYSGVYTAMKPYSIYNTWVGAVVGAIPPVMGWTAATAAAKSIGTNTVAISTFSVAGAASIDPSVLQLLSLVDNHIPAVLLAGTLYYWQLPHFMALSYMHRSDYKRGGFAMLPCFDEVRTSNVIVRYTWYLSTIPFLATMTHTTSSMFALEGLALNSYALYVAYKFKNEQSNNNARQVFLTSLWYLPCLLMLFLLHSKTFEEDLTNEDKQKQFLLSQAVTEYILTMRKRGRELCVHETAILESPQPKSTKESCPIVFVPKTINDTSTAIKQEIPVAMLEKKSDNDNV
jgi:heme o synthase